MIFNISSLWTGSRMVSFSPVCSAPQALRLAIGGVVVYSNWISWLMAAKKLNFIRSCSNSCSVRSEAASSSWRCISSATLRSSILPAWPPLLSFSSRVPAISCRHSSRRGLNTPHSPLNIMETAFSWLKGGL